MNLIGTTSKEFGDIIDSGLRRIGEFTGVDRVYILK